MLLKWIWWTCHALSAPKFKPCYEMPRCLNALCKTPQLKQKLWILGYTGKREKPGWSYDNQELKFPSWAGNHLYPAIVRKNDGLFDVTLWQSNVAMESFMSWGEATDKMDTNGAVSSARLLQHTSIIIALPHTSDFVDVPLDLSGFHRCYITFNSFWFLCQTASDYQ